MLRRLLPLILLSGLPGTLLRSHYPPPEHPANVCFGGVNYQYLFITARTSLYSIPVKIPGAKPKAAKL
jgi:sugar lactone lactonase YvrE